MRHARLTKGASPLRTLLFGSSAARSRDANPLFLRRGQAKGYLQIQPETARCLTRSMDPGTSRCMYTYPFPLPVAAC